MNSRCFPSFIVIIFLSWRVDKLERRHILKESFLKYNNLKSEIHLYNTYKNKLHHTIGAETIRKKRKNSNWSDANPFYVFLQCY